ncbi:MAG: Type 1 glutamine amidotransferase-like domain-containing protein [Firmicutes bacterium]|nr:Type 1 glutamine amidotransferase-like domain-containing protein [Bacillota bacterium]
MKIVAIGGGENGREGYPYEIKEIDEEIVRLADKSHPNYLFIGFASGQWADSYFSVMEKNFGQLGCRCEQLKESQLNDEELTRKKIQAADIIYVGGGNTLRLMKLFRKFGLDKLLEIAGQRGAILCGVSAGAICWCKYGNSDSRRLLIRVAGLGFINALFCPHFDKESARQADLVRMMKTTAGVALAFEECTALKIIGDNYEIIKSRPTAKAYKCFYYIGEYKKVEISASGSLTKLLQKV